MPTTNILGAPTPKRGQAFGSRFFKLLHKSLKRASTKPQSLAQLPSKPYQVIGIHYTAINNKSNIVF